MKVPAPRRCLHCFSSFIPDYRNVRHQRFCSASECRQASKRASQRRWLRKPENRNYFREPDNAARVREWRLAHPGYWRTHNRRWACRRAPDLTGISQPNRTPLEFGTLQDFCRMKITVLTSLIAHLGGRALQEEIAVCARQVLLEAQCILKQCHSSVAPAPGPAQPTNYHETG